MHAPRPRISVERIIKPHSVAIIGASEDEAKFGGRIMHNVVRHGYAGELLPINPGRETILGRRAYPNIAAAPGPIDLALIAVPATQLRQMVEECGAAGVGACVVITAQLGEFDEAGKVASGRDRPDRSKPWHAADWPQLPRDDHADARARTHVIADAAICGAAAARVGLVSSARAAR